MCNKKTCENCELKFDRDEVIFCGDFYLCQDCAENINAIAETEKELSAWLERNR